MRSFCCHLVALFVAFCACPAIARSEQSSWEDYDPSVYNLNETAIKQVGQVFGFVAAQEARSTVTAAQYPALAPRLKALDTIFSQRFSNPKARSETVLRFFFGDQFNRFVESGISGQLTGIASTFYSETEAYEFANTLEQRIEGRFDYPDALKTMLWLKYAGNPAGEVADGWTTNYSSRGDVKASGLDVRLQVPFSWKEQPGDRPHVVRRWGSQNGTGTQSIMLLIRDVPELAHATENEIRDAFSDGASFLPQGAQFHGQALTEIDGEPSLRLDYSSVSQRAGLDLDLYVRSFMLFVNGKYVALSCSGPNNEHDIEALNDLCFREANSMVFMNLWD